MIYAGAQLSPQQTHCPLELFALKFHSNCAALLALIGQLCTFHFYDTFSQGADKGFIVGGGIFGNVYLES